ncbi:MAG TPA: hypothetical protein VF698_00385 [Thermoanaerobaculia bacterium]|jgi:hypothetical protein
MRRKVIAAVWIAAALLPLLMASLFVFGCCVLPFHQVVHKAMPVCGMAADMMRGGAHDDHATPPAREKQEPVQRMVTTLTPAFRFFAASAPQQVVVASASAAAYRSFITLGAIRCDSDIGLHALFDTFLI